MHLQRIEALLLAPNWIQFLPVIDWVPYTKNSKSIKDGEILIEKNIGRDVHTFFYHLYTKYNDLADVTFFSQDYPFDYGFIPQTHWYDGDPLDVVLLTTNPLIPGVLVDVRPVAVVNMIDEGESDSKIIAVPVNDPRFDHVRDLEDINKHTVKEIVHFFETYKHIQNKVVKIDGVSDAKRAKEIILESTELYKTKFNK